MRLRFKSLLTLIFILIIACIATGFGYRYYKENYANETVVVADGNITINFLSGNKFSTYNNEKLQFSVTNNGEEEAYFYIRISDIKGDTSSVTYEITNDSSDLNISDKLKANIISSSIAIEGNKTDTYTVVFKNETEATYSGKIIVGSKQDENTTFADIILKNNEVKNVPKTTLGNVSDEDEGLIKTTDDLGESYYFRGKVENNYVSFADLTWRIVKINGDGSIKIVLNTLTETLTKYYENKAYEFSESYINNSLDNWYKLNLSSYSSLIVNYKYCNDLVYDDSKNAYIAYDRITINKIPTFECLGTSNNGKVGLLTADEVMLAGASTDKNNAYYLYNSDIKTDYYTMTSAKYSDGLYYPFIVATDGALASSTNGTLLRGLRPVINIIKNSSVLGDGTKDNPYTLNS